MKPETVEAILQAAQSPEAKPESIRQLLLSVERDAVDQSKDVEDVTVGLKAKLKESISRSQTESTKVAERDARILELETAARADSEERQAADAGLDNAKLETMAEERANAKFKDKEVLHSTAVAEITARAELAEENQKKLESKLFSALVDNDLVVNAPGANPTLYGYLREKAEEFYVAKESDEGPWWDRRVVEFDIKDPATGTVLRDGDKPMTGGALVKSKKDTDWAAFFPPTGRGGGAQSGVFASEGGRLPATASSSEFMASALSEG